MLEQRGHGEDGLLRHRLSRHAGAVLIRLHGSEAHSTATNRAEEFKAQGDEAGYAAFTRIAAAVREIGQLEPAVGERRH